VSLRLLLGIAILGICGPAGGTRAADALPAAAPPSVAPTLEELTRRLAATPGVTARFEEQKHLALLESPVESRGRMHFVPPGCLSWSVESPGRSQLVIEGDRVRFQNEASPEALDLSGNPMARHFAEAFMVLFNGDLEAMKKQYSLRFEAGAAGWRLELVPRSSRVRALIESIVLAGRAGPIDRMVLLETDGDRTVTTFAETELDRRFAATELRELFGAQTSCGSS